MNRERKYRAWHTEAKEMLYGAPESVFSWLAEGQPIIINDYTGLKDLYGVEIYEGDIVNKRHFDGEVECLGFVGWDSDLLTWNVSFLGCLCDENRVEVVGNIFQSPELLQHEQ